MVLFFIVIVWVCMRRLKREGPWMDDGRDGGGGGEPRRVRLDDIPPARPRADDDARPAGGSADRPVVFFGCNGHDVEDFSALLAAGDDTEEAGGDELGEQSTGGQPGLVLRDPRGYGCE